MIAVESTAIAAVGYDGYHLFVQFHTSDKVYDHPGVPPSVYVGLMNADSMGAYDDGNVRKRLRLNRHFCKTNPN